MKIKPLLFALTLLPAAAFAEDNCKFTQPQSLQLDLAGAKAVVFEINQHDLRLQASPGAKASLAGRACASTQDLLGQLSVTQQKVGDKLVVKLERKSQGLHLNSNDDTYAYLDMTGSVPDTIMVQLKVGSGDASVTGAQALSADVGSGDIVLRDIKGLVTAAVGSGDLDMKNIGGLNLLSMGSGDAQADGVRGDARIGSVGSGDVKLERVQGSVTIDSVGSGEVEVKDTSGGVAIGSIGSGDVDVRNAASLSLRSSGSGSVDHSGIRGTVDLPKKR